MSVPAVIRALNTSSPGRPAKNFTVTRDIPRACLEFAAEVGTIALVEATQPARQMPPDGIVAISPRCMERAPMGVDHTGLRLKKPQMLRRTVDGSYMTHGAGR